MKLTDGQTSLIDWACANEIKPGETQSGDHCLVKDRPYGVLLGVIDGLGHGKEAFAAAHACVESLDSNPEDSVLALIQKAHDRLRATRGVVMTLASLNSADHTLTWLGVGNVQAVVFRSDAGDKTSFESVLLRGGVVGYQLPALQAETVPIHPGDLILAATDGIDGGFTMGLNLNDSPYRIAEHVMKQYFKGNDDALVMAVRYLGRKQ